MVASTIGVVAAAAVNAVAVEVPRVDLDRDASGAVLVQGVRLDALLERAGVSTPAYVYDVDAIRREARELRAAFGEQRALIAFAVKANSAGPIVRALHEEGVGADVVSGGELALALACGIAPADIVMSGVGKTDAEIDQAIAIGDVGIAALQAESVEELPRLAARARALGRQARVSFRINPGIEADTHAYIATGHDEAKFGIPKADLSAAMDLVLATDELCLVGLGNHIGSQLVELDGYVGAARMLLPMFAACDAAVRQAGRPGLEQIDFGGGFGIDYGEGRKAAPADFAAALRVELARQNLTSVRAVVEPGRSLVGSHGYLCATVLMHKVARSSRDPQRWLMIDAGMNDLMRPALYQARHRIEPLESAPPPDGEGEWYRVVGPVCESSDDFGLHTMPTALPRAVVVRDTGAYGFTMASEYNARALPSEIFVSRGDVAEIIVPRRVSAWLQERLAIRSPAGK